MLSCGSQRTRSVRICTCRSEYHMIFWHGIYLGDSLPALCHIGTSVQLVCLPDIRRDVRVWKWCHMHLWCHVSLWWCQMTMLTSSPQHNLNCSHYYSYGDSHLGPYFRLTQGSYDRLPHDECYYAPSTNCSVRPTSSVSRGSEARWCRFTAREDTHITWGMITWWVKR